MTPHEFIAKWRDGGDERRGARSFFEDRCRLVGHPTPREADQLTKPFDTSMTWVSRRRS